MMFEQIFLNLLEISIQASTFILAITLIRLCFRQLPKRFICILWTLVAVRLLCPVQITSVFSLVPDTSHIQELADVSYTMQEFSNPGYVVSEDITLTQTAPSVDVFGNMPPSYKEDTSLNPPNNTEDAATYGETETGHITLEISALLAIVWATGTVILIAYGVFTYLRTKLHLREAVHHTENIWYCSSIPSPFVMGYIKPRIYIPFSVDKEQLPYIIAHEKTHIAYFDHLGKLLGYILLSVYWFNPVIWIGYILYCRDLELACDERVLAELGIEHKKAYSNALLTCSGSNKALLQSPLAFSEVAIKTRITNILNYKKPGFWCMVLAIVICIVSAMCFMTNSEPIEDMNTSTEVSTEKTTNETPDTSSIETDDTSEALAHFANVDAFIQANIDYWKERLVREGRINEEQEVYNYLPGYSVKPFTLALHKPTEIICYYYTLDDHYIYTLYRTTVTCNLEGDGYYIYSYDHAILDGATTAAEANEMLVLYDENFIDGIDTHFTLGHHVTDSHIKSMLSSVVPGSTKDVQTPASALEKLMHFSGGTAKTFPGRDDNSKYVLYTFADGSQAAYEVKRAEVGISLWYPASQISLEKIEEQNRTENFILQATLEDMKEVTEQFESGDLLVQMPDTYTTDVFRVLDDIPEKDVTLYSLLDGSGMILRDGNTLYPLFYQWYAVGRVIIPEIYKNDYDKDGVDEYALYTLGSSGSICQIMNITMLEPEDNGLHMQSFNGIWNALNNGLSYEYQDHTFTIKTRTDHVVLNVEYWEEKCGTTFCELGWGNYADFKEDNGQWWISILVGIKEETAVTPQYNCGVILTAPVTYHADNHFEVGDFSMEVVDDRSYLGDTSYNGFVLSIFDYQDGTFSHTYTYADKAEDVSIFMNNDGLYSRINHNGKKLEIETYGHFYDDDGNGYALPYLVDVTGDGNKDLILEYASLPTNGTPYLIHKSYVYRLDTMEEISFNTDTAELSKLMIFTPKSFNAETNEVTLQVEFDESIHPNLLEFDRTPYETTITIAPEQADYWTKTRYAYIPNKYNSLYFNADKQTFTAEFIVYLDSTKTYNQFYPFYVDYIWDEATNSFIMDLSTARTPAAG